MADAGSLVPGFMVVHGNRMHDLRALAVEWLRRYPLSPLENEVILVQSNGIAQWLKLALARDPGQDDGGCGIAAALDVQLPARFLWSAYRAVLGADALPDESPLAKSPLAWRLMRLLPECLEAPQFASLARFLGDDPDLRKRWQLAGRLADLFDQYQVYRADWLDDWAERRDVLRDAHGAPRPLPDGQCWQAALWRAVLDDLEPGQREQSRAAVHRRFMARIPGLDQRPPGLPRRVIVFGISSLPAQALEALEALGRLCQVLLCVHNPCEHYWADIVADRDLLRAQRQRQARKPGMPEDLGDADLHQHAHPLLAAWGKQGRDYIRLLDLHDDPQRYGHLLEALRWQRIDLFESHGGTTLLNQLQDDIRELRPLHETRAHWPAVNPALDQSLRFHVAHSPQREVEVLHDQLLDRFQRDPTLRPRDVIVMVPDVEAYAPQVQAVFGQVEPDDPRYLPFALSDRSRRGREPLLVALEQLLALPESRLAVSDLLDLLEVPALRRRFGIRDDGLQRLHAWIEGAGIRWGLDAAQRASLGLPDGLEQNTWQFGLRRMLLGYAVGGPGSDPGAWNGIEPYDEVGGLDAALVGQLDALLAALGRWWSRLGRDASPSQWAERLRELLRDFFEPEEEREQWLLTRLDDALEDWEAACQLARTDEPLPLTVVRESWLATIDEPGLSQRFLGGAVNVCTLMPMRAVPFRIVCLLGMNDGEYPRIPTPADFDLMARHYRPGDRSRREDDRYLFLEALLSAREQLYVSWVGRSVRDDSERPPSVLVTQLRDHVAAGWRLAAPEDSAGAGERRGLLEALTVEHPLQPFSPRNFPADGTGPLFTYAREWEPMHRSAPEVASDSGSRGPESAETGGAAAFPPLPERDVDALLTPEDLGRFLRNPVQHFFNRRLGVFFDEQAAAPEDHEPFSLDGLGKWEVRDRLAAAALAQPDEPAAWPVRIDAALQGLRRSGWFPIGGIGTRLADGLQNEVGDLLERYRHCAARFPGRIEGSRRLAFADAGVAVEGELAGLRADPEGRPAVLRHRVAKLRGSAPAWRYDALAFAWVQHLLANATGFGLTTLVVGTDADLEWRPLEREAAETALRGLLDGWREGQRAPLPVACQTACAWLEAEAMDKDPADSAGKVYAGNWNQPGEVGRSPYHARVYPTAESLIGALAFRHWAGVLYGPLLQATRADAEAGA
ncbi:exodeoxyribonuclease V subunit gamma [Thioalkalivibrio paradoxus]|uniref:RecBCD enzyme subunit RecC n=1 Tax=Thioalkalivibrio paradoxus ARh 1 TaxID=713585 RepID=W0DJH9_9GAMM|nr:exodeoxyribonuclease V subunit gamma [Thioalkalivibrio paradoxus]AHE97045.1 exodeoxyribonuclease V subunit gamma [Thioalkalivibrio paradoxus ARh 1]